MFFKLEEDVPAPKIVFSEEATLYLLGFTLKYGGCAMSDAGSRENSQTIFFCDLSQWKVFCFSKNAVNDAVFLGILEVIILRILGKTIS